MLGMSLRSNGRSIRPDTDQPSVSHEELVIRVNVLAAEIARLTRELRTLREAPVTAPAPSTVGPVPVNVNEARSGRALIRMIAVRLNRNEDGVRKALTSSKQFAPLREKAPDICTNVPLMRWIASADHFERIMAGESFGW